MDREGFRNRMKQYKKAREENPGLKYWEWKAIPKYEGGTGGVGEKKVVPTVEEYISEQIDLKRTDALNKSLTRTMPRVPYVGGNEITISRELFNADKLQKLTDLNNQISQLEKLFGGLNGGMYKMMNQRQYDSLLQQRTEVLAATYELLSNGAIGPSCIYTATDNYGDQYLEMSNKLFMLNSGQNGFKNIPIKQVRPGDIVIRADDEGGYHGMIFDSYDSQGRRLYNHSNGGHTAEAIRKKAKYPAREDQLSAYTFVGTPVDSAQWKNEYKQLYGYVEGGEVEPNPLEVLERSKPKVAGIPINDKPLSGTDPIGELYLNLVSGNAVRKAIKNGINTVVRKSFYDSYKALLKAGWNRRKAYEYASPELGVGILPGITKGFDYTIKGANYTHAVNDFIK